MKELLQQYAAYNIWANKLLIDSINKLSTEQINTTIQSSFPSIYKTAQHIWFAEEIWWQRLKLIETPVSQAANCNDDFTALCNQWQKQSQQWKEWIDAANDNQLTHVFAYIRNKEQQKMKVHDMLLHVFNHATYHRGQLVTLLRQLGQDKIPATDFVAWVRLKHK